MTSYTWQDLYDRIVDDLDLQEEVFVDAAELLSLANSAINEIESIIHKINEDYFLTTTTITLASGTSEYALPADIFANKLRKLYYINGDTKYPIKRIKNLDETLDIEDGDDYKYLLVTNSGDSESKAKFYPTPAESGAYVTVWYLRNAQRIISTSTTLDIPEGMEFIIQYVKEAITNKERFDPEAAPSPKLLQLRQDFIDALTDRTQDEDNLLELGDERYRMLSEAV